MKTKEQIFEDAGLAEDFMPKIEVYSKIYAFQRADEYAEEYAKAFIEWLRKTRFAGELTTETLEKFKESLKK